MAEAIISFLIPKLTTLLSQEYTLLHGLQSEVRYISDELGSMSAFLRIAEAKLDADVLDDEQKEWFKQVMGVAYDTEDAVDQFLFHFAAHGGAGFGDHISHVYTSVKNLPARHQIASKIRDIKDRVKAISKRHKRYKSSEGNNSGTSFNKISEHPIRGHALLLEEADLVGIDQPKREIISLILTNESHLKAISVVGMGGLGKTTLVKRVFEDSDVKTSFTIHAWLTISETFIIGDALKNLVHQIFKEVKQQIPEEVESMDRDGLRAFIKDFLKDRRYIIFLDDLWKSDHWDSIKHVFPDDICGSRIIITTRIKDLATTCCREFRGNIHEMQPLSPDASWKLFCKKTFGGESCPQHLTDISHSIMNKCGGHPLGIVAVGGLLTLKDTSKPEEWEMVLRSLGGELEGSGKLVHVKKILLLSYNDLPYYLKYCLLYMGIFPEDEIVETEELACLWIAEGFVEVRPGMTAMEVAQSYLNELIGRSLIQVAGYGSDGSVIACRVHDLTYEVILSKCKELNILAKASTPHTIFPENVRRLMFDEPTFQKEHGHLLHLRSLIISKKCASNLSDSSLSRLLKGTSKLLKVLYLESSHINIIPKKVFKLYNLTYLNLKNTNVTNIPKSIKNLLNLEYLNLGYTGVTELPSEIIMLKKLSRLVVYRKIKESGNRFLGFKAPHGLGSLISLRDLVHIEADGVEIIREIGKLTQLRRLGITNVTSEDGRELCSSLEKLTNLQLLTIQSITQNDILDLQYPFISNHRFLKESSLSGGLVDIPHWVPSCHSLTRLFLEDSCLREDPLRLLEGLPNLSFLSLDNAYIGDTLNFKAKGFQKLKKLQLGYLSGLKLVTLEKGTLPYLKTLAFKYCTLLDELPQGIRYLSNLRKLSLISMPERLKNKLRSIDKESDEYRKFAHITEIFIGDYIDGKWKGKYLKW